MILQQRPVGSCGHTHPHSSTHECPGDGYICRTFLTLHASLTLQESWLGLPEPRPILNRVSTPLSCSPTLVLSIRNRMLSFPRVVACSRTCSRFLGLSLGTASLCAAGANIALLFPNWDVTYLMRGLIGKHAVLGSGLWGGGLMVLLAATLISMTGSFRKSAPCLQVLTALLSSGLALLGAVICFVTSGVALKDGPFCMFDISSFNQTQAWKFGYPFKDLRNRNYLYDHSLWTSVCLEPSKAVVWHVAFFSILLCISLLQLLLVAIHLVNSVLGLFCSFCEKR